MKYRPSSTTSTADAWHCPNFKGGYVWNRDQVRGLFDSLYRRHPVGGLLVCTKHIDTSLNLMGGRRGRDHDQVLFGSVLCSR